MAGDWLQKDPAGLTKAGRASRYGETESQTEMPTGVGRSSCRRSRAGADPRWGRPPLPSPVSREGAATAQKKNAKNCEISSFLVEVCSATIFFLNHYRYFRYLGQLKPLSLLALLFQIAKPLPATPLLHYSTTATFSDHKERKITVIDLALTVALELFFGWGGACFGWGRLTCKGVAAHLPPNSCLSSDFGHFILEN